MHNGKIKSRWSVPVSQMSNKHIDFLLNRSGKIIKKVASEFIRMYPVFDWNEIYSFSLEGFYFAIRSYNPNRGNLNSYAYYYSRGWVNGRIRKRVKVSRQQSEDVDLDSISVYSNLDDKIFCEEILSKLDKSDAEILKAYSEGANVELVIAELKLNTPKTYYNRLKKAIQHAKEIYEHERVYIY